MAGNILVGSRASFNAQHSPMGAFVSFTCGCFGSAGGLAAELGKPAGQDLYIGFKDGPADGAGEIIALPLFSGARRGGADAASFQVEQAGPAEANRSSGVKATTDTITRSYRWASDTWWAGPIMFRVYSPFGSIPDPAVAPHKAMREALTPAVLAELTIDNSAGAHVKTLMLAVNFNQPGWVPLSGGAGRVGFGFGRELGFLTEVEGGGETPRLFCRFSVDSGIGERTPHMLGTCPGVTVEVPAGQKRTLRIAIGAFLDRVVTTGLEGRYLYTRYFGSLGDVLGSVLDRRDAIVKASDRLDRELEGSGLTGDQQFVIAHSTRSYYGSTQLLEVGGEPFWVVNEGEYCMLNTLDLSVDHVFWETRRNPWVVGNLLDNFLRHYSFVDKTKSREGEIGPGGISFCHDMGVNNHFTPRGESSYELSNLTGCFSHMTAEQLCNWILIAAVHGDTGGWAARNRVTIDACGQSLLNRCGDAGFVSRDSDRCGSGSEITTYDSLDHSLAQTRNNLYMAVKCWAAMLGIRRLLAITGERQASIDAWTGHAKRAAERIAAQLSPQGVFPAVFEEDNPGYASRILPAAEGLVYPLAWGDHEAISASGPFGAMIGAIRSHTLNCLTDPERRNLFADGGLRLSSTSNNSWMSKIAIFMHVSRRALGLDGNEAIRALFAKADAAHVDWQIIGSSYWACCDQIVSGEGKASKYYPRIITTALWMEK